MFFAGLYYSTTILNSNVLFAKYKSEGVEFRGSVSNRRTKSSGGEGGGFIYIIEVAYDIVSNDEGGRVTYTREFGVSPEAYDLNDVALIRLPNYPRSALLLENTRSFDEDLPPTKDGFGSYLLAFSVGYFPMLVVVLILAFDDECSHCIYISASILIGYALFDFLAGYWFARKWRDISLRRTLYGAKKCGNQEEDQESDEEQSDVPKSISYKEFFNEDAYSCMGVFCHSLRVFPFMLVSIYFLACGGPYLLFQAAMYSRMKQKALSRYESHEAMCLPGTAVARPRSQDAFIGRHQGMIVTYQVGTVTYKKRMKLPSLTEQLPDDPELMYLPKYPASAELKRRIEESKDEHRFAQRDAMCHGLWITAYQVLFLGIIPGSNMDMKTVYFAGIVTCAILIAGCVGGCVNYYAFFLKDLLHGAIVVPRGEESHRIVEERTPDVDHGVALELGSYADDETAASEERDSAAASTNFFPGGAIPEGDRFRTLLSS